MIFSLSEIIAPIKTKTKRTADIFFAVGSNEVAMLEENFLNNKPIITGTVTIKNMLIAKSTKE